MERNYLVQLFLGSGDSLELWVSRYFSTLNGALSFLEENVKHYDSCCISKVVDDDF